mgnify:CR=1 FL=1
MTGHRCPDDAGRHADAERGAIGVDWLLILPLFIGAIFAIVSLAVWPERQGAARAAAAEGARAAVLVTRPSDVDGVARSVAREVLDNYGIPADAYRIAVSGDLQRGENITVEVTIELPVIRVPFGPDIASRNETYKAVEEVGLYREIEP